MGEEVLFEGIDVSRHQGHINWAEVNTDFVIIRAGWSWYNGGMNIDQNFIENVSGAYTNHIPFGVYLYAYDKTPDAAVISAKKLIEVLKQYSGAFSFPVVYDFEDNQYLQTEVSRNTEICKAFLSTIKNSDYYPMLYTYTNFANSFLNMEALKEFDFWVADYRDKLGYEGDCSMWQYSSTWVTPGISTKVDLNRCWKNFPEIITALGLNGYEPTKIPEDKKFESLLKDLEELIGRYA